MSERSCLKGNGFGLGLSKDAGEVSSAVFGEEAEEKELITDPDSTMESNEELGILTC